VERRGCSCGCLIRRRTSCKEDHTLVRRTVAHVCHPPFTLILNQNRYGRAGPLRANRCRRARRAARDCTAVLDEFSPGRASHPAVVRIHNYLRTPLSRSPRPHKYTRGSRSLPQTGKAASAGFQWGSRTGLPALKMPAEVALPVQPLDPTMGCQGQPRTVRCRLPVHLAPACVGIWI
jgi:hypothetical protein